MGGMRKIAAILVADIVGYSRLAGTDEDRTLARLRGYAQRQCDKGPHRGARRRVREVHPRGAVAGILWPRSSSDCVNGGAHQREIGV